jgi:hypothetical protein
MPEVFLSYARDDGDSCRRERKDSLSVPLEETGNAGVDLINQRHVRARLL